MAPVPQNIAVLVGGAVIGIVSAAAFYIVSQVQQKKSRHEMSTDLDRLRSEVTLVKSELDKLMKKQSERHLKSRRKKPNKTNSIITSTTTEDFMSAPEIDSSDLEFYDVSDEEDNVITLEQVLPEIDKNLNEGVKLEEILDKLRDLCIEHPENPELLWRMGKAHYKIANKSENEIKSENIRKGIEVCESAMKLSPNNFNCIKWLAILIGARSDFQPMKEKIADGQTFKNLVEKAISLDKTDPTLHHMLGRFCYEIAGLKWYERKAAAAFYATPPTATYDEALDHFEEADKLNPKGSDNCLFAAKTCIALGRYKDSVTWLHKTTSSEMEDLDEKSKNEVDTLLDQYAQYR